MKFTDLPPRIQRIVFLACELIREEPCEAQLHLISMYTLGLEHGKTLGLDEALSLLRKGNAP